MTEEGYTYDRAVHLAGKWMRRAATEAEAGVYLAAAASAEIGQGFAALALALRGVEWATAPVSHQVLPAGDSGWEPPF